VKPTTPSSAEVNEDSYTSPISFYGVVHREYQQNFVLSYERTQLGKKKTERKEESVINSR
jgi:hypothetical protein